MITEDVIDAAGVFLADRTGLRPTPATRARLESSVRQRAERAGIPLDRYVSHLGGDRAETQALIDAVTVQETSFFRDPSHIDAVVRDAARRTDRPTVVWSAGCATGQEPYSLAMALDEAGIDDWRIVATDLSRAAVERTRSGRFAERELRGLSQARRGRYLAREGDDWLVDPMLRDRISVLHHNLLSDPVPLTAGEASAVFCRNVFIYLQRDRIHTFLARLRPFMTDGAVLFVGGSESLWHVPAGFALAQIGGAYAYRKVDMPAVPPTAIRRDQPLPTSVTPSRPSQTSNVRREPVAPIDFDRSAVEQFRRATYLEPGDPLAHLQLALSMEADGDLAAGRRAFRAARVALERADAATVERRLEGWGIDAIRALIDLKLGEGDA